MKKTLALFSLFIGITPLLMSCKTPVRNIEESQFVVAGGANLEDIKRAIFRACKKSGWKVKSSNNKKVIASYSYKNDKFGAVVSINYDNNSYDIIYVNSHNLQFTEHTSSENDPESKNLWNESQEIFYEYNPFDKSNKLGTPQQSMSIHKIYNKWVSTLDKNIGRELDSLGGKRVTSFTKTSNTGSKRSLSTKKTFNCNDQPTSEASGMATISSDAVNLRTGASTTCNISGSISRNDTFSLLGQKNNWYYISSDQNQNGWVYAPLVVKINTNHQEISKSTPPPEPETPLLPTKNISIAVIHFKTLNKEAQDIALGDLISETFTSALVNSQGFKIIEREQLDKVVKEMEMSQTGFIETTDAVEIGKMLHADAIITGSVALLNNQIQLNARIIEIESAYVISAETKTTTYTLRNITKVANEMVSKLSRKLIKSTYKK